jgi:hypothetical protein
MDGRGSHKRRSVVNNIVVKRYAYPESVGWQGWIEPEDKSWIAFIDMDGRPVFYLNRDPETGAILGPPSPQGVPGEFNSSGT